MVKPVKKLKKILLIMGITGAVYGGFRYLLPLVIPFLLAYAAALWMRPSVRFIETRFCFRFLGKERRLPVWLIGGAELLLFSALLFWGLYLGGKQLFSEMRLFFERFPDWLLWLDEWLTGICLRAEEALGLKEGRLVGFAGDMVGSLKEAARQSTMPLLMTNSMAILKKAAEALVFLVIFFVAALLCLQEMDDLREKKSRSTFHREFSLMGRRLVTVGNAWLKTQFIILVLTSILCILALFLIGSPYAILFGIGIGLVDALPVLGAGAVLIPWGIVLFAEKAWWQGTVLLVLYAVCYLLRQFLEAKIMGGKVGLSALETLASMYVGLKLFGLAGFLLGPIGYILIEDLVDLYWEKD